MKKTILVTGSTDGIGKLVAKQFAAEGHQVIIHGRNSGKTDKVISEIKSLHKDASLLKTVADFSDLSQVSILGDQLKKEISVIDVLINNAGVFKSPDPITKDKLDVRFVVNYLAHVVLTNVLMPLLSRSTQPRIISLSSAAQASVSFDALAGKEDLPAQSAYAQSKLALTMWSNYLSQKLSTATVIAVNPGSLLNTRMAQEAYGQYWSSADKGSKILYQLALSEKHKNDSGKYFDNDKGSFSEAHADAYNQLKISSLIDFTNSILQGL